MTKKTVATALVLLLLSVTPAQAQISIPIPIPSLGSIFGSRSSSSQAQVDPREHQFVQCWNAAVQAEKDNNYPAAIELWRRALSIHPQNYEARLALAQAYRQGGMTVAAIAMGRQLLNTHPKDEAVWRLLLHSYMDTNQLELAMSTAQQFVVQFPGSKYRKTVEIDIQNLERELGDRSKAPTAVAAVSEDNYLPFACEEGVFRWPVEKMPIKVYVGSGKGVRKWNDEFPNACRQAFDRWQNVTQGMMRFTEVADEASADIVVQWDDGSKDVGHAGHAGPDQTEDGWIKHAHIVLHTQVPHMHSDVTPTTVYETAQHEIGHALGLLGHSDNPNDIMYWSATPVSHNISMRDVRTLVRLYTVDPRMIDGDGKLVGYTQPPAEPQQQAMMPYQTAQYSAPQSQSFAQPQYVPQYTPRYMQPMQYAPQQDSQSVYRPAGQ